MRVVLVLFDSLNRDPLQIYGGKQAFTPNLQRLAERAIVFDRHYVGSLPCMPARRDMHTGRLNFLHRSWGPLEPFDNSFPEILSKGGVYSHLITDHYHYFEDGGATYHNRFSSWEAFRGQEWDPWKGLVEPPIGEFESQYHPMQMDRPGSGRRYINYINRRFIKSEEDYPSYRCFEAALDFLKKNHHSDRWFLQIETFDPHEPFQVPDRFKQLYPESGYRGPVLDWPRYKRVEETELEIAELKRNYAASVSFCDFLLGRLLNAFDALNLWTDTALIVTTDHGFLLGEHGWFGKSRMPVYNEIAHIPLVLYHPDLCCSGSGCSGTRCDTLSQTIDLMPTILDLFGFARPGECLGKSLLPAITANANIHSAVLYGMFGGAVNITDGDYTYFRYSSKGHEQDLYEYTLMPTHQASLFEREEFLGASLDWAFSFTKGMPVLRLPGLPNAKRPPVQGGGLADTENRLFDLGTDPLQLTPVVNVEVENRLIREMIRLLRQNEAPAETFRRLGLEESLDQAV